MCCSRFVSLNKCSTLASAQGCNVFFFFQRLLLFGCLQRIKKGIFFTIRTLNCCLITAAWLFSVKFEMMQPAVIFKMTFFFLIFFFASQSRPRQFCPFICLSFSETHIQICAIFVFQVSLAFTSGLFSDFQPPDNRSRPNCFCEWFDSSNVTFGLKTFFGWAFGINLLKRLSVVTCGTKTANHILALSQYLLVQQIISYFTLFIYIGLI